jgi:hypothetical protein
MNRQILTFLILIISATVSPFRRPRRPRPRAATSKRSRLRTLRVCRRSRRIIVRTTAVSRSRPSRRRYDSAEAAHAARDASSSRSAITATSRCRARRSAWPSSTCNRPADSFSRDCPDRRITTTRRRRTSVFSAIIKRPIRARCSATPPCRRLRPSTARSFGSFQQFAGHERQSDLDPQPAVYVDNGDSR